MADARAGGARRAVFLDRDGTIVEDPGFLHVPGKVKLLPGAASAIKQLNDRGFLVIIVTNQSGIARGLYTAEDYAAVQRRLAELLQKQGAHVDAAYFCPHHPLFTGPCDCRKPGSKLFREAQQALDIAFTRSWWVGDRLADVQPARPAPLVAQIPIRVGQTVTGRLVQSDQKFSDGSRYKMYAFVGNKRDTVAVDLTSDDFDANLLIADAAGNSLARNDDSGEKCNARLTFVPPATANYRIYANSSSQAEIGEYHLSVARGRAPAAADTVCRGFGAVAGLIEVGQTITGNLTSEDPQFTGDSTYFQRWILPVRANQAFTVDLQSDDFDAYLMLTRGRGEKLVSNDDGGGGCNARLVYTAQDDHPLRILVNTASRPPRQTGHFTLRVSDGEAAVETKGNCRFTATASASAPTATPVSAPAAQPLQQKVSNVSQQSSSAALPTIRVGESVNGALTDRDSLYPDTSYFKFYQFTAPGPSDTITIDLSSDDFDPVLIVRGDDLDNSIINDDGGPGCSSRIVRAFPSRGPYRILVNTTNSPKRQTGNFTLSITRGVKPV